MLAPRGIGNHQARDVPARGDEHQRHRAEQQPQRSPHTGDLFFLQRHDRRRPTRVGRWKFFRELSLDRAEIRLRPCWCDAWFHAAERGVETRLAGFEQLPGRVRRHPYLGRRGRVAE